MFTAKTSGGELLCSGVDLEITRIAAHSLTEMGQHPKVLIRDPSGRVVQTLWFNQGKVLVSRESTFEA